MKNALRITGVSVLYILLNSMFITNLSCQKQKESSISQDKIIKAKLIEIVTGEQGKLEIAGEGDDKIHVLTLQGSPYEMGKTYGTLMKKEINEHLPNLIHLMSRKMGESESILDEIYSQTKPFIPQSFIEEMEGIADGCGLSFQEVLRANLIGEASEWHCSLFGAWGNATAADGHLYQLRSLDYETQANIQKYPVVVVYFPSTGFPFANVTWAGVVGCISGISSQQLAISEIGDDYDKENDTFAGIPFMFMLRDILQFDSSLEQAITRVRDAHRTTSLMYGIGDGEVGELRGLQTSHTLCNVYDPNNLEPLTATHRRIEDIVYWGMSWNVPGYDGPLHDKLMEHYGNINAVVTINDVVTSVGTGDLQTVVYDLTAMKMWVANAKANHESGPLEAYNRQFVEFDMNQIFKR